MLKNRIFILFCLQMFLTSIQASNRQGCPPCEYDVCEIQGSYFTLRAIRTPNRRGIYTCPHCKQKFEIKEHFKSHIIQNHKKIKNYCKLCDAEVIGIDSFGVHCMGSRHTNKVTDPLAQDEFDLALAELKHLMGLELGTTFEQLSSLK